VKETEKAPVAEFKVNGPFATSVGKRWLVNIRLFQVNSKPLFSAANRVNPIYFDFPFREVDEIHIALPPNTDVESLPPDSETRLITPSTRRNRKRNPSTPSSLTATWP
jgi:hypothetical protein